MEEKNKEITKNIDSSNIFDEFVDDTNLIEEVDKIKQEENKDLFYYISKTGHVLQTLFLLGLIATMVIFSYIYFQNDENLTNSTILDPFCGIILGDIVNKDSYCSSITSLHASYTKDLNLQEKAKNNDVLSILEKLYKIEHFVKSKEVIFLADKSESKLQVLQLLEEFDKIKNDFIKEKQKIQCSNLVVDSGKNLLSMSCISFAEGYEKGIIGFDGTKEDATRKGTSLSIANSFINFIDKNSLIFDVTDRQKMFRSEDALGNKTGFSNQTTFNLKLNYNLK